MKNFIEAIQEKIEEKKHEQAMKIVKGDAAATTFLVLMFIGAAVTMVAIPALIVDALDAWLDKRRDERENIREVEKEYDDLR